MTEAYAAMTETGYRAMAVPAELGGAGATLRQVVLAQYELARWSGAAALSSAMHLYLTLLQRWRYGRGFADAEAALRKVAADGLVIATSGGTTGSPRRRRRCRWTAASGSPAASPSSPRRRPPRC